jgi:hypothetical protein
VVRLIGPDGRGLYLKRQENHGYRDWRRGMRGLRPMPTVVREWQVCDAFRGFGLGTAEPVCLGVDSGATSRGLLMTVALDGYRSLHDVLAEDLLTAEERRQLWFALADLIRAIHDNGYRHNCLYGQHLLLKRLDEGWDIRLIDLEKAVPTRRPRRAAIADLSALDRHTDDMSNRDRRWLWDRYFRDRPIRERRPLLKTLGRRTSDRFVDQYLRDCAAGRRE